MNLTYAVAPTLYYATFPFTVVNVLGPGGAIVGSVYTTAAAPAALSFNKGPQQYIATATVNDNNPAAPMSASSAVTINVTWVARPPYFNTVTQAPGSAYFQLQASGGS